jgi:beta-N-acetylhexosaminidase
VKPGGVILFRENFETVPQVTSLVGDLMSATAFPLFLAVDEEGGLVSRLVRSGKIPATPIPSAETIGNSGDPETAAALYGIIARELKSLGLNMNFAPVADVLSDPDNPVIQTRAFSSDPETAADFVAAGVRGLEENGVVSVVKHFPGHGDSSGDSHFEIISLDHDLPRLNRFELVPFRRAVEAGAGGIMTAHLYFPQVDGAELPASLSPYLLKDLLREDMEYDGLIITDALEMRGLRGLNSPEVAGVTAISNGADMLLIPPDPAAQRDALLMEVVYRRLPPEYIDRAVRRIISVKITQGIWYNQDLPDPAAAFEILGNAEHREMLRQVLGGQ